MKYVFRVNHKLVTLDEFYQALMLLSDGFDFEASMHELLETGSFEFANITFSIEVA